MKRWLLAVPVLVALLGAYLLGGASGPRPAVAATPSPSSDGIVVDGVGRTAGVPDVLRASLGISLTRPDLGQALADAARQVQLVREALRRDGVAERDLQTSQVSLYPSYDRKGRRDGYAVSEELTAKLRRLDRAGRTLSRALLAGGTAATLGGVSFTLEDNGRLLVAARNAAFADAKAKAQRYADLAGRPLGAVQLVSESTATPQVLQGFAASLAAKSADRVAALPIDPGTSALSVSVTVRWSMR